MGSLLLKKHDLTMQRARELIETEIDQVSGGDCNDTITITAGTGYDGSCELCDNCPKK